MGASIDFSKIKHKIHILYVYVQCLHKLHYLSSVTLFHIHGTRCENTGFSVQNNDSCTQTRTQTSIHTRIMQQSALF